MSVAVDELEVERESLYRWLLDRPRIVERAMWLALPIAVLTVLFLALGPHESLWSVFDHVAAAFAFIGLLIALPALSYAAHTDRRIERAIDIAALRRLPPGRQDVRARPATVQHAQEATVAPTPVRERYATPPSALTAERPCLDALARWLPEATGDDTHQSSITSALSRLALEGAIKAAPDPQALARVLRETQIFAVGKPAGDTSVPGYGTESEIVHFEAGEGRSKRTLMPLFTSTPILRDALIRNPAWQSQAVLEIDGGALLDNRDPDVTLVIDPWSPLEYQLPPA